MKILRILGSFFAISIVSCLGGIVAATLVMKLSGGRLYSGDLLAFVFWSVPLNFLVGGLGHGLRKRQLPRTALQIAFVVASGILLGSAWTYLVRMTLGIWFATFSFPVLPCWIASAVAGLLYALLRPLR